MEESAGRVGADASAARAADRRFCTDGREPPVWPGAAGVHKIFVDNVVTKKQIHLLTPIVLGVLAATILQGITSFTLTQLLSKSAQRMITELRRQVQAHIGRLPVSSTTPTRPAYWSRAS